MFKSTINKLIADIKSFRLTSKDIKQYLFIMLGAVLISSAFVLFITPYKIVPGGVYGAGIALNYLFPSVQVGTWGLLLDIPLMVLAFIFLGGHLGLKTVFAALLLPLVMNFMTDLIGSDPATMFGGAIDLSDDILLACMFGGVILGAGGSFILRSHATSGGTDIIAMLISKFAHIPIARALLMIDSLVVVFGLIVLGDWKIPLYSLVTIYVCIKVIDLLLEGGSSDKLIYIISDHHDKIRTYIIDDLGRGGTYIKSAGMYTKADKEMIFVVISRREVPLIKDFVHSIDKEAFMVVVNAHETLGDGFKAYEKHIGG